MINLKWKSEILAKRSDISAMKTDVSTEIF